jgi:hypothetical protein
MAQLGSAQWNAETLLELYTGLLDHAQDVRDSALAALKLVARQQPQPATLTPLRILRLYFPLNNFDFLVELGTSGTSEALSLAREILTTEIVSGSNAQFEAVVTRLIKENREAVLEPLRKMQLSKEKSKILRAAIKRPVSDALEALERSARFQDNAKQPQTNYYALGELPPERD